ncbi:winged helix-turn-helix transcriptional regulator [Rhizobium ruizarguesonis]
MHEKQFSEQQSAPFSPIETALDLLSGRWKCTVLFHLLDGTARFSELRRRIPSVTQKALTSQLRELERDGLIERRIYAQVPARVDYSLSPFGCTLEPILQALHRWGDTCERARCEKKVFAEVDDLALPPAD